MKIKDTSWESHVYAGVVNNWNVGQAARLWWIANGGDKNADYAEIRSALAAEHLSPAEDDFAKQGVQTWFAEHFPKTFTWFINQWAINERPANEIIAGLKKSGENNIGRKKVSRNRHQYTDDMRRSIKKEKRQIEAGKINMDSVKAQNRGNQWKITK